MTSTTHADQIIAYVKEQGLQVEWILETHVHADHLTAAQGGVSKSMLTLNEAIIDVKEG